METIGLFICDDTLEEGLDLLLKGKSKRKGLPASEVNTEHSEGSFVGPTPDDPKVGKKWHSEVENSVSAELEEDPASKLQKEKKGKSVKKAIKDPGAGELPTKTVKVDPKLGKFFEAYSKISKPAKPSRQDKVSEIEQIARRPGNIPKTEPVKPHEPHVVAPSPTPVVAVPKTPEKSKAKPKPKAPPAKKPPTEKPREPKGAFWQMYKFGRTQSKKPGSPLNVITKLAHFISSPHGRTGGRVSVGGKKYSRGRIRMSRA